VPFFNAKKEKKEKKTQRGNPRKFLKAKGFKTYLLLKIPGDFLFIEGSQKSGNALPIH